jgi:hypothetical protein
MTNEQWCDLTRWLKLPEAARSAIEAALNSHEMLTSLKEFATGGAKTRPSETKKKRPSEAKKKLQRSASLAGELLDILENLESIAYDALIDPAVTEACVAIAKRREAVTGNSSIIVPRLENPEVQEFMRALHAMAHHHGHLTALHDRLTIAAETFAMKGKTGSDTTGIRNLLRRVSEIVETHTGKPLSKGKRELDFACKLGELAYPPIGRGSIKEAIENLEPGLARKRRAKSA